MAPSNEAESRNMLYTAYEFDGPAAVRYPRGIGPGVAENRQMSMIPIGTAEIILIGHSIVILAFGSMLKPSLEAGDQLNATVVNMRFVKPLDSHLITSLAESNELIVTVEENVLKGGAGSGVNELLNQNN